VLELSSQTRFREAFGDTFIDRLHTSLCVLHFRYTNANSVERSCSSIGRKRKNGAKDCCHVEGQPARCCTLVSTSSQGKYWRRIDLGHGRKGDTHTSGGKPYTLSTECKSGQAYMQSKVRYPTDKIRSRRLAVHISHSRHGHGRVRGCDFWLSLGRALFFLLHCALNSAISCRRTHDTGYCIHRSIIHLFITSPHFGVKGVAKKAAPWL
jgi:hypothetical protein